MLPHLRRPLALLVLAAMTAAVSLVRGQGVPVDDRRSPEPAAPATPAQRAAARPLAALAPSNDESPVELSPFLVVGEEDQGYKANSTLAGTRLRTELRDVAASLSVVTREFMQDLGVNNLDQLMVYTLGTEVTGLGGNYSGAAANSSGFTDFDGVLRSPGPAIRVRSLGTGTSSANVTRDYFVTDIPMDGYNTDRVEVSRGPNAMLFGLGSPQGIVNSGLLKPQLRRARTRVETQLGRFGTYRATLDTNQVVRRDLFALRFAALYSKTEYMQEPAYNFNRRAYLALTLKPTASTTLKFNGEIGLQRNNRPQGRPPLDNLTAWWTLGKPVYDPTLGQMTYLGTAPANPALQARSASGGANGTIISSFSQGVYLVSEDPNVRHLGYSGLAGNPVAVKFNNNYVRLSSPTSTTLSNDSARILSALALVQQANGGSTDPRYNFWKIPQLTDASIYDFYTQMLEGPNKYEDQRWHTLNLTFEQRLGRSAGLEVAFDRQMLDNAYVNPIGGSGYALTVDINSKLPNGQPNPSFGRPFFSQVGWVSADERVRQALRATAYYDLDLRRVLPPSGWLAKVLGRHVFTGSHTNQYGRTEGYGGRPFYMGYDYFLSEQAATSNVLDNTTLSSVRALTPIVYVGPSLLTAAAPQAAGIQNVRTNVLPTGQSLDVLYYQSPRTNAGPLSPWRVQNFSIVTGEHWDKRRIANYNTILNSNRVQSSVFVANSRWFANTLVSTVGVRRDLYRTYDAGTAPFGADGLRNLDPAVFYQQLTLNSRQDQTSYGLVGHSPAWLKRWYPAGCDLSLTYNRSDNFTPGSQRFTVYNQTIAPSSGTTRESGAVFQALGGKLELRVNHFETGAVGATNGNLQETLNDLVRTPNTIINNVAAGNLDTFVGGASAAYAVAAWKDFLRQPVVQPYLSTFGYVFAPSGTATHVERIGLVVATSDVISRGWEYDLVANPTKSWRLSLNASQATAQTANTARDLGALLASWKPFLIDGSAGDLQLSSGNADTVRNWFSRLLAKTGKEVALDGTPTPEMRRWRFNGVTSYTFRSGTLKDWSVGGAVRWQDKSAIGYPVTVLAGNLPQLDIAQPFYGPRETNYDAWCGYSRAVFRDRITWKAQLNVRNLGVGRKLIPVAANPDGRMNAYRIAEPMVWTLTNSFEF